MVWSAKRLEGARELGGQQPGAAVEVRLEDRQQPPGADDAAGRGERRGEFGGVVGEVVVDAHAAHLALEFEAALGPLEPGDRRQSLAGRVPQPDEHPERAGGVERVVQAGNREGGRVVVAEIAQHERHRAAGDDGVEPDVGGCDRCRRS